MTTLAGFWIGCGIALAGLFIGGGIESGLQGFKEWRKHHKESA